MYTATGILSLHPMLAMRTLAPKQRWMKRELKAERDGICHPVPLLPFFRRSA
jgi:hypothetical protein